MWWQGSRLVVRALRDLAPGMELLHCYGPQAGEHITPLRRQLLQQQYHFHCMCDPRCALTFASSVLHGPETGMLYMHMDHGASRCCL
jgi:hypothetical protein